MGNVRVPKSRARRVVARLTGFIVIALVALGLIAYARSTNDCADTSKAVPQHGMNAFIYCEYGSPSVLHLANVERPVPGDSQVLVRVHAASVNPLDWHYMRGTPRFARLGMGLRVPKVTRLGVDFAGTVEAVGSAVTRFKLGDSVFGARTGAFAEYVTIRQGSLVAKPSNVSFAQAAAVPVAALAALQGVRDQAKVHAGDKVLINGASGGVGTFAVQIAKLLGAEVTGVSSTRNLELIRKLGADHVVDYTKKDFTRDSVRYDVIIDNVGNQSISAVRRVLTPAGRYVMIGGPSGGWIDPFPRVVAMTVTGWFVSQDLRFFLAKPNVTDLTTLRDMLQAGSIVPVIDREYRFRDTPKAIQYLEGGHARGKVVINMSDTSASAMTSALRAR